MSKKLNYIYDVCRELKEKIIQDYDNGCEITVDEIDDRLKDAFKVVAKRNKKRENTVRAACTRDIGMKAGEFYDAVRGMIVSKDGMLVGRMCSRMTDEDSEYDIERKMNSLFHV